VYWVARANRRGRAPSARASTPRHVGLPVVARIVVARIEVHSRATFRAQPAMAHASRRIHWVNPAQRATRTLTNRIEIDPDVMLGKPVIRGTRIPVELILRKLSEGLPRATYFPKANEGQRSPAAPSCVGSFALGAQRVSRETTEPPRPLRARHT
jgi:hypothetical protein